LKFEGFYIIRRNLTKKRKKENLLHAEALVEDVVVVVVGRWLGLGPQLLQPWPLARAGLIVVVVLEVDKEAEAERTLGLLPLRILPAGPL
jgi:hypothetical protein